ncbi:MAG: hypothetical protein FWC97_01045, partial [Treponema sp.]|nr:hypothetical protein [Treponema sp.]
MTQNIAKRLVASALIIIQMGVIYPFSLFASEQSRPIPPFRHFIPLDIFDQPTAETINPPFRTADAGSNAGAEPNAGVMRNVGAVQNVVTAPSASEMIIAEEGGIVRLDGAKIEIPPGALREDTEIRITRLWATESTGGSMNNATAGGGGYRFEPSGTTFIIPVVIRMSYAPNLSESAKETLFTYYFNTEFRRWVQLERVGIDGDYVTSLTTHFTDMINGTLALPEGPSPLSFNINSIKGLEAANPSAGVPGIEGLEANNTGTASFRIPIDIPPGRAGMTPQIAITYSSDGGNGIMGRGFDLQAGSRITIDTRWGVPRFNGRYDTSPFPRDVYMLDGVLLEEIPGSRNNNVITYRALRETRFDRIERFIGGNNNYWVVTDRFGTQRTFGRGADTWSGQNAQRKYTWELEEERDIFGNTIRYYYKRGYRFENNGVFEYGRLFLSRIIYTGHENSDNMAAYEVRFKYDQRHDRYDRRIYGRGGFVSILDRLLDEIHVYYLGTPERIRRYRMTYKRDEFGVSHQLIRFGQLAESSNTEGDYFWSYEFSYITLVNNELFGPRQRWSFGTPLQVQTGTSDGWQGSLSAGVGVGVRFADMHGNYGRTWSGGDSSTNIEHKFIDLNGNGRPDSVEISDSGISIRRNLGGSFEHQPIVIDFPRDLNIGRDTSDTFASGWYAGGGVRLTHLGLGTQYSQTSQRGGNASNTGFVDIDGDGLVDIVIGGRNWFFRNESDDNSIRFVRTYFVSANLPADALPLMGENEEKELRKELDETFLHLSPLREWRAAEEGTILIRQYVESVPNALLDGYFIQNPYGVIARTFFPTATNTSGLIRKITITSENRNPSPENDEISIRAENSIYFLSDARGDTRGSDINWKIIITYREMRYLGDMNRSIRHVLPHAPNSIINRQDVHDILLPLYDDLGSNHLRVGNRTWENAFANEDRDFTRQAWEKILELGWYVPGFISAEHFGSLWDKATKRDGDNGHNYRDVLRAYFLFHAGDNAYIRNPELSVARVRQKELAISSLIQEDTLYFKKLARFTLQPEGSKLIYGFPVPIATTSNQNNIFLMASKQETIEDRELDAIGYISPQGENERLIIDIRDVIDGQEIWSIAIGENERGNINFYPITVTEPFVGILENQSSHKVPYFINGDKSGWATVRLNRYENLEIIIPIKSNYNDIETLQYEFVYTFTNFNWISESLSLDDMERVRLHYQGDVYTIGSWKDIQIQYERIAPIFQFLDETVDFDTFSDAFEHFPPSDPEDEGYYVLRDDLTEEELDEVQRILTSYGWYYFLSNQFTFYQKIDDVFLLKAKYNVNITEKGLGELLQDDVHLFNRIILLLEKSMAFNFVHYTGNFTRSILYYSGGMHTVENGGIVLPVLVYDNGRYSFKQKPIRQRTVSWESGEGFSTKQPESQHSYSILISEIEDIDWGDLDKDQIEENLDKAEETVLGFNRLELLYGGVNRWYYAIWLGNQQHEERQFCQNRLLIEKGDTDPREPNRPGTISFVSVITVDDALSAAIPDTTPVGQKLHNNITGRRLDKNDDALIGPVSRIPDFTNSMSEETIAYFPYIYGNRIHTSRMGGLSYYHRLDSLFVQNQPDGRTIPMVRRSNNTGIDRAINLSADLHFVPREFPSEITPPTEILEGFDSPDNNLFSPSLGLSGNFSWNNGSSHMYQSIQSINGSGMADILQSTRNGLIVTEGSRDGFVSWSTPIPPNIIPNITSNTFSTRILGGTIGASGTISTSFSGSGRPLSFGINGGSNGGRGGSFSVGSQNYTRQTSGFIDMTGDGLPDFINGNIIRMNLGRRESNFRNDNTLAGFTGFNINRATTRTIGVSSSRGIGGGGCVTGTFTIGVNVGVGGGTNYSVSVVETTEMLIDMNGDGLPDKVKIVGSEIHVWFNLGNRFADMPERFSMPQWGENGNDLEQHYINDLNQKIDGRLATWLFQSLPLVGNVASITGLDDFVGETGFNSLGIDFGNYLNSLETNSTVSVGLSASANAGGTFSIWTPWGFTVNVTGGGGGGFNIGTSTSGVMIRMMDMTGDGLPDRVLRIPGTNYLLVQPNLAGDVGLLRNIRLPQGGEIDIRYELMPGTTNMPGSRYVMSEVTRRENREGNGLIRPNFESVREYTTIFSYYDGFFDREVKEFYGFRTVIIEPVDCRNRRNRMGRTERVYYNDRYNLRGMVQSVRMYDERSNLLRESIFTADNHRRYARYIREIHREFEVASGTGNFVFTKTEFLSFDNYGNVKRFQESASGSDILDVDISFRHNSFNSYLRAHPTEIRVYGSRPDGSRRELLRRRTGEYDPNTGALLRQTQMLGSSQSENDVVNVFEWDRYGNLTRITDRGGRGAFVEYVFDPTYHQFLEEISRGGPDIVPYRSYIRWDTRFGRRTKEIDENGNIIEYKYDDYGRLIKVWSPYAREESPTITHRYVTSPGRNWYAVTENKVQFDNSNNDTLTTVIAVDGLGRILFTAKQGEVWRNRNTSIGWNVSGFTAYDARGRAVRVGQPLFVDKRTRRSDGADRLVKYWNPREMIMLNPTVHEFDSLDRVRSTTLPDGNKQTVRHEIRDGRAWVITTDPLGNRSLQARDGRGNITRVERQDRNNNPLTWATYRYNGLGELLVVYDANGPDGRYSNPLRIYYDRLGRRIRMTSADIGVKEWHFDSAGNLVAETNSELVRRGA